MSERQEAVRAALDAIKAAKADAAERLRVEQRPVSRNEIRDCLNRCAVALSVANEALSDAHRVLKLKDDERPTLPVRPMSRAERAAR